jgi:hypothetical protein
MTPNAASPVLRTSFTITGNQFGTDPDNIRVFFDSLTTPGTSFECGVCTVTDSQIGCKFNGGAPGTYQLRVTDNTGKNFKNNNPSGTQLVLGLDVSSITPKKGSHGGGTLLTITGTHFSAVQNENQVTIGVRNLLCDLQSATETQITCITRENNVRYVNTEAVAILGKVSFEATCNDPQGCTFLYSDADTPMVNSVTLPSNILKSGDSVTLDGTQFSSSAVVELNGITIVPTVRTATQIQFTVPDTVVAA